MNSIDIFPWNEGFNTGVSLIDDQHRQLIRLLNLLASHVAYKTSGDSVFDLYIHS